MRILKFGGKSLGSIKKTQKICKYIKKIYEKDKKIIVVVSAMGSTTDNLIELVHSFNPQKNAPREFDSLLSTGETLSSSVVSIILLSMGVPAKSFQAWQAKINTRGGFQNSLITSIEKENLDECLNSNTIAVVAGFQGINKNGDTTTLGRGGSDTTACALGAIYNTNVELYSDFNGMFSCDPREISTKKLSSISFEQLDRATSNGAKIVSNRAVKLAKEENVNLILKSSSKPALKGTIANNLEKENTLISTNSNLCQISVDISNESKIKIFIKNVLIWLKNYKIYNLDLKNKEIKLLINQSDKDEILKILCKKLNILKS